PFENFKTLVAPVTRDRETFGRDSVTRRALVSYKGFPTMHSYMAHLITARPESFVYRGEFKFYSSDQVYINYHPQGTYKPISFYDVLNSQLTPETFANKIVLVGANSELDIADYIKSPYSRELLAMSSLEAHANIIDTLILNNAPVETPPLISILLTCLVSILIVFVVLKVRPANGLVVILFTLISLISLSYLLFAGFDIFLTITHPILAVFICYYFFIPYRLILENRKSWEYYHKNKLLTQVEELKSNFMRMMSHDLKTPLARIQGMTEIIKHEANLKPEQQKALNTINESSEELTEFIGSILSLGRIESKEIKLNLQSKDINSILEKVIKKYEFSAHTKNIEVITEFEPLFSVNVDEDLIKQVFANLIENAIKYSPENSKVLISTEEKNGKVLIQVADQGIGIEEKDQAEVFSKFYRSPKVTNGPIKGSGLGLYLANYFVKLHSGKIQVESQPLQGSTFTVELPTELDI
ncbi:MAG: CHASE2 domain-containing protein, partial [Bdellovibrionales bacterium]|nr:CHASE2 domain-containing protein [Bdellovibrionales bacterium]